MRHVLLVLMSMFALAFVGCASNRTHAAANDADGVILTSDAPIEAASAVLEVHGLSCPLCATNLDKTLESLPGVASASISLSDGLVDVEFAQTGPRPSPRDLSRSVTNAGFTLVRISPR